MAEPSATVTFRSEPVPAAGGCRIAELLTVLGQPHMLELLHTFEGAEGRPLRFNELETRLGISPKTLSRRLRTLVEAGFLSRRAYKETPPRVEYAATVKTAELGELFSLLERWAQRNNLHPVTVVSVVGRAPVPRPGMPEDPPAPLRRPVKSKALTTG